MTALPFDMLECYAFADLAAGKEARSKNKRNSRQVIVVGLRDWFARWFFPYIWAGKETATDFKKKILEAHETYRPRRFGLEANGMQVLFGAQIRDEAREKWGDAAKFGPIYQPTNVDKNYRIRIGLEPVIDEGRLFLLAEDVEARAEIRGFPTAATKDIVDAIETCIDRVAPPRIQKASDDFEREEFARYLRNTGMAGHLIERKIEAAYGKPKPRERVVH